MKNKQKEREKIQNEPCLPGEQTNVFAKKFKKSEKEIKREKRKKIKNEQAAGDPALPLVRKKIKRNV